MNMYSEFKSAFKPFKHQDIKDANIKSLPGVDQAFIECIIDLGGKSYNDGIYSVFDSHDVVKYTELVTDGFSEYKNKISVFGTDWLGRYFAIDTRRKSEVGYEILFIETGVGEALQIPESIVPFHNSELVECPEDVLAESFFNEWRSQSSQSLEFNQCVGFKTPLFLGGSDSLENLEIIDRIVYTDICGQLQNKTRTLREGQSIGNIDISD